jgi:hypothetical protein
MIELVRGIVLHRKEYMLYNAGLYPSSQTPNLSLNAMANIKITFPVGNRNPVAELHLLA